MTTHLYIPDEILAKIHQNGEQAYPEEGAGLMLGREANGKREVLDILPLTNSREDTARHNRYLITADDMLAGEMEAMRRGLDIVGVFHSHPDHPNRPSEFDRDWALPWYSYVITSIQQGQQAGSRSWRLAEDRSAFSEEAIIVTQPEQK
ncbi:M67 family metallopeptidase [bacterium]|nr:M67 family metallopeptidase [bacterium]MCB2179176.1 M67 family metallopeptidase [bacterium]